MENCRSDEKMAGEVMAKQISERRRRSRAGSNLNFNFNGGGVVLLLGAAAGALLASAFAAHRIRAHKRRRGSMTDGIQGDSDEHLGSHEAKEFVGDEGVEGDGANTGEGVVQVNSHENLDASIQFSQFDQREMDFYSLEEGEVEVTERSPAADIELVDRDHGKLPGCRDSSADISSSPADACRNLGIGNSLGENQRRCDDEELVAASIKEECKTLFINCKEDDEEDNKKDYLEEWNEVEEIEEKLTSSKQYSEQPRLIEKKTFKNLEMVIAIEERKFEDDGFEDEMHNSILEFVLSRAKEMATSSPFGDQDEINPLIEKVEPFFEGSGEAKKALDMTQNDSGKHPKMVIMEDQIRVENGGFKDAVRLDILCAGQDNENGDASDDQMVEGSRGLNEQTVALPQESSFTAISELETSSTKDLIMVKAKEDVHLIAHIKDIVHIEEDKMGVDENNYLSADEGVERLIEEIQGTRHPPIESPLQAEAWLTESCIRDNPAMIIAVEEKTQSEYNTIDVIQEEKTEENLSNGFEENVESSETEENIRENKECPLTEYQRIEFSLEQDNLMACKESTLIQFQGIKPIVREEKASSEDWLPFSLESNMKDNKLSNSEKTLEREECHLEAGAEEFGTSLSEEVEEWEGETNSVQCHELQTRQYIETNKDKLEREIEYPQALPGIKNGVGEMHTESQAQIIEEEEDEEGKILKLSFDPVEKGAKIVAKTIKQESNTELIDVDKKHQYQLDGHENIFLSRGKQQRIATKKVKGIEYMFMGYSKGHIFLVTTVTTAFTILAFLYAKDFITRTTILEDFISG